MAKYKLSMRDQLLLHFSVDSSVLREGAEFSYHELRVKVKSGQYFASVAMTLDNLSNDPYIEPETLKYILRKFSEEFLYLQDAYQITKI